MGGTGPEAELEAGIAAGAVEGEAEVDTSEVGEPYSAAVVVTVIAVARIAAADGAPARAVALEQVLETQVWQLH